MSRRPPLRAEESSGPSSSISAGVVASQLQALGYAAKINSDKSGDPRVKVTVDGFAWDIFFYNCGSGPLEQRGCASFQFYTGYTVPNDFSLQTINKWNTDKRFAKAYTYVKHDGKNDARIEVDVLDRGHARRSCQDFPGLLRQNEKCRGKLPQSDRLREPLQSDAGRLIKAAAGAIRPPMT